MEKDIAMKMTANEISDFLAAEFPQIGSYWPQSIGGDNKLQYRFHA